MKRYRWWDENAPFFRSQRKFSRVFQNFWNCLKYITVSEIIQVKRKEIKEKQHFFEFFTKTHLQNPCFGVMLIKITCGRMVEWFKAAVLKTAEAQVSEGSNPSLSAIFFIPLLIYLKKSSSLLFCKTRWLKGFYNISIGV